MSRALPPGAWRIDPFTSVLRYAYDAPPTKPAPMPCGTVAAYKRHMRHGETPCDPCRVALREDARAKRRARMYKRYAA